MTLVRPKIVVLDSSTLGNVSRDYWAQDESQREKARQFLAELQDLSAFITFSTTHIIELLRHKELDVVQERLGFLRKMPFIAWLRPYNRNWFPGCLPDLFLRELHVVVHDSVRDWPEIVDRVRQDLWETGTGEEMFVQDYEYWSTAIEEFNRLHEKEKYVASLSRTDPGNIKDEELRDVLKFPKRPKERWDSYMQRFSRRMQEQLDSHGDKRLEHSGELAAAFAENTLQEVRDIDSMGEDHIRQLLQSHNVPPECVTGKTTIGEIGELCAYAEYLKCLSRRLHPMVELTMKDVPHDTLPSYFLTRKLSSIQVKANRVSGSDIGDAHIVPLTLYADHVEVDKRTSEFVNQIRRNEPEIACLMRRVFKSSDYSKIPENLIT